MLWVVWNKYDQYTCREDGDFLYTIVFMLAGAVYFTFLLGGGLLLAVLYNFGYPRCLFRFV